MDVTIAPSTTAQLTPKDRSRRILAAIHEEYETDNIPKILLRYVGTFPRPLDHNHSDHQSFSDFSDSDE